MKNFNLYDMVSFLVSCEPNFNLKPAEVVGKIDFLYEKKKVDELKKVLEKSANLEEYDIIKKKLEKDFEDKLFKANIEKDMIILAIGKDENEWRF